MSDQKLVIVFALFPGVTQLDFTGPHLVFSRLPGATVVLASRAGGTVEADGIDVACGRGRLRIERLQLAGRKPLAARDFIKAQPLLGARFARS